MSRLRTELTQDGKCIGRLLMVEDEYEDFESLDKVEKSSMC